jgi:surfeit locus 1 family protein
VQRLHWKTHLLARIAALQNAAPRPLAQVLARGPDEAEFARVAADCPGIASAAYVTLYSLYGGQGGYRLISRCDIAAGPYRSILVDRGFIVDTVKARPAVDRTLQKPVRVVGVLRAPDKPTFVTPANRPIDNEWYSRDIAAMAEHLRAPSPAPLFLMAESATNPELAALKPVPLPAEIPNRHLEYALTWFGLAAALVGVYAAFLWRKWKS